MGGRRAMTVALVVALTIAVAFEVVLAGRVGLLEDRLREALRNSSDAHAGVFVPTFVEATLNGDSIVIAKPGERQLLFFLTTTCPYCRATVPVWNELSREFASRRGVTVLGVVLDSAHRAQEYRDELDIHFPLVVLEDRRYAVLMRANTVPLTMIIDGVTGRMVHARSGELVGSAAVDSIRTAIVNPTPWEGASISLPPPISVSSPEDGQ